MFFAFDENRQKVNVNNATKDHQYFCPICGECLSIRAMDSLAMKAHFAHKRGTMCDDWDHDMSEWHCTWQEKFPEEYREVVVENNGVKHRADILINNTVIEFQHSPITAEELKRRNDFYLSCGYNIVWVFDATNQIQNRAGGAIDPMQCRDTDLCWKRAKRQFNQEIISSKVTVYLQYKTCISYRNFPNQEFDIMLLLRRTTPKDFTFFKTSPHYITPENFLKQYGLPLNVLSIEDIIKITQSYMQPIIPHMHVLKLQKTRSRLFNRHRRRQ